MSLVVDEELAEKAIRVSMEKVRQARYEDIWDKQIKIRKKSRSLMEILSVSA